MLELALITLAGLLGSSHCLGMCGPFAATVGQGASGWLEGLARQLGYSAGRIATYAFLGTLAGFGGWRLENLTPSSIPLPAILAIVAGLVLVYQGLLAAGLLGRATVASGVPCLAGSFFAEYLTAPGLQAPFLAGLFTGFIPCGLVYAFLALATATGTWHGGLATMVAFGLGTVPVMVLAGCGAALLAASVRRQFHTLAAWSVILTGLLTIVRGGAALPWFQSSPGACPFCH
jgi:sulfite exporter TauE/SafE